MANKNNDRRWLVFALLFLSVAVPAYAQSLPPESSFVGPPSSLVNDLVPCGTTNNPQPCGYNDFLNLIERVFDYLVIFAVPLAAGVIVVGGAIMMTAGTNDSKRSQAKKIIWMAIWGLVIVLASYLIVKLVFTTLVKSDSPYYPSNFK